MLKITTTQHFNENNLLDWVKEKLVIDWNSYL
jgi:hypothetical protein